MGDSRGLFPWRRRPERGNYYYNPRDQRQAGGTVWRGNPSFLHPFQRRRHDEGPEGVPGRGRYNEFPRREPYAGRTEPARVARRGPYVAPSYQAPLHSSAPLPGRAEPLPRPLHHVHMQPPPPSWPSRHYQPYAPVSHHVEPARLAPTAAAPPLPVARAQPVAAAAAPEPVAYWQPAHKYATRRRQSLHSLGHDRVSGFESDARTSAGASLAESRHGSGAATTGATTTRAKTTRSGNSSRSSSSSETARVIHMMKTQNFPKAPPDNWQSAVRLATVVVLSGTVFSLVMLLAFVLETTVLLPWDTANTDVVTKVHGLDDPTAEVAENDNATTPVAPIMPNDASVQPENLVGYDEGVVDTTALV